MAEGHGVSFWREGTVLKSVMTIRATVDLYTLNR